MAAMTGLKIILLQSCMDSCDINDIGVNHTFLWLGIQVATLVFSLFGSSQCKIGLTDKSNCPNMGSIMEDSQQSPPQ